MKIRVWPNGINASSQWILSPVSIIKDGKTMWIVALLVAIIIILMGVILFGGGGISRQRKLRGEISALKEELARVQDANEALRKSLGAGGEARAEHHESLFELARDLDSLRSAIAGSKICQNGLMQKYNTAPGPELLERILERPGLDPALKRGLADEILVGEVGRAIMKSLSAGATLERAAADAGVPLVVAKGQVTRLHILGYLDARMKLTDRGREVLEPFKL